MVKLNKQGEIIHVCLAADDGYFTGLNQVVVSMCLAAPDESYRIHIIDGGIAEERKRNLLQRVSAINEHNEIVYYRFDQSCLDGFRVAPGHSYMAYARIFMPSVINIDRVIYLDSDLLVLESLCELWEVDLKDRSMAAAHDPQMKWLSEDYPLSDECPKVRYFNSGVMVVDLEKWREMEVQNRVLALIRENPSAYKFWDQTAFNALFKGDVAYLNQQWNCKASITPFPYENVSVLHFLSGFKPWMVFPTLLHDRIWSSFYCSYGKGSRYRHLLKSDADRRRLKDGLVVKFLTLYLLQIIFLYIKFAIDRNRKVFEGRLKSYKLARMKYIESKQIRAADIQQFLRSVYNEG